MKIFIFLDKQADADKAKSAVEAAGHEAVVVEGAIRLGMSDVEILGRSYCDHQNDTNSFAIVNKNRWDAHADICKSSDEAKCLKKEGCNIGIIMNLLFRFKAGAHIHPADMPHPLLMMGNALECNIPCCMKTDENEGARECCLYVYGGNKRRPFCIPPEDLEGYGGWVTAVKWLAERAEA